MLLGAACAGVAKRAAHAMPSRTAVTSRLLLEVIATLSVDESADGSQPNPRQTISQPRDLSTPPKLLSMTTAEAKNLEAISRAIDQHNGNCEFPAAEVRMNPFEVERLGWSEIRGLPVVPDPEIGTGRFRIVCSRELDDTGVEEVEAVGAELQTLTPARN